MYTLRKYLFIKREKKLPVYNFINKRYSKNNGFEPTISAACETDVVKVNLSAEAIFLQFFTFISFAFYCFLNQRLMLGS